MSPSAQYPPLILDMPRYQPIHRRRFMQRTSCAHIMLPINDSEPGRARILRWPRLPVSGLDDVTRCGWADTTQGFTRSARPAATTPWKHMLPGRVQLALQANVPYYKTLLWCQFVPIRDGCEGIGQYGRVPVRALRTDHLRSMVSNAIEDYIENFTQWVSGKNKNKGFNDHKVLKHYKEFIIISEALQKIISMISA
ncbi:hypothetical protein C8Q73DRAFT_669167 [Cubamyces lactineus]|nr:hypothetical protein C8Q73DRAFT_669167 [Cubamyces lactineus]